jgi:hypothetical protein
MKSRLSKSVYAVALAALAGALVVAFGQNTSAHLAAAKPKPADFFHDRELDGTWRVTVQQTNCQTGAPLPIHPFQSFLSFAGDGVLLESTINPGFAPGQRGPGHGIWSPEGHHTFSAKSTAFITYTGQANPMTPVFQAGTQTITQAISFKDGPDEFTSDATVAFADLNNNVYMTGCATATAQRYE